MNHVSNRFSGKKKVFMITFISSMVIATVGNYSHCSDSLIKVPEKAIEHDSDTKVQSYISEYRMPIAGINASMHGELKELMESKTTLLMSKNDKAKVSTISTEQETEEQKETETEVTEEVKTRSNILYYVHDSGENYDYYLDTKYQDYLYEMCAKYNVTDYYTLFLAQMYHESRFDEDVISQTNDYGLMQINKSNHSWLGDELGNYDFLDPYNNIEAGVFLMSGFLIKYGDVQKSLVCYNRGESAVVNGTYSTSYSRCVISDMDKLVELKEQ